ncbi:hypothetical protein V2J09_012172 [Rumex salicifolius]
MSSELDKLLSRCPELQVNPALSVLVQKGKDVEDERLVNALVGLFVHPGYTIQILGCFRRMGKKIMNKVVTLLQLVIGPRFNSDFGIEGFEDCGALRVCESFDHAKVANLIELYSEKGKALDLHEFASLAFCRALDLAPFLHGCVKGYYKFAPSPFVRIEKANDFLLSHKAFPHVLLIFQISYRFLLVDPDYFKSIWEWSFLLKFIRQIESVHPDDPEYMSDMSEDSREHNANKETNVFKDIRWLGAQILSALLNVPNRPVPNFGLTAKEALACFLRWQEFCSDVSKEKADWYTYHDINSECTAADTCSVTFSSAKLIEIDPPQSSGSFTKGDGSCFVMTSAIKKSFERVVLAVNQKWPVLLYGPTGCGKTALINKLAQESGNQVLTIHMDEQIDGRTLVGSYVCTEQPGEFRWQPGSLSQAVANGLWVVLENIDQAPSDVHPILLPLLEGQNSFATGHGEAVQVAQSFRLFSTITSSKLDASNCFEGRKTFSSFWRRIMIRLPSREDLNNIVTTLYPDMDAILPKIIGVSLEINKPSASGAVESVNSLERFSLRDILKFCKRISSLGLSLGRNNWTPLMWSRICLEAVDIFACSFPSSEMRMSVIETISKMLNVPMSSLVFVNRPSYQDFGSDVQIGRVTLKRSKVDHQEKSFVHLRSSLLLLERVACSVKYNEPVLLVGETGTGKTTLVQNMAMKLGKKLTVLNLSQQSDVSDLLGGFKPVDARSICIPLYNEFMERFCESSLVKKHPNHANKFKMCFKNSNWKQLLIMLKKDAQSIKDTKIRHGVKRKRDLEKEHGVKRKRDLEKDLKFWENMFVKLENALRQLTTSSGMMFKFVEGAFITALQKGEWILLDEVNLAPPETLSRILGVLDGEHGSLCLAERGDIHNIARHPNFRIFACMNPANDAGKRDLPCSLRSRFTEYFVDDVLDAEDLTQFVCQFNDDIFHSSPELVDKVVHFYIAAKQDSETSLLDGANQKPQYSLRSLYRALEYTRKTMGTRVLQRDGLRRALYDGFCMFFMSLLEENSAKKMGGMIVDKLLEAKAPEDTDYERYLCTRPYTGPENFVLTESVKKNLRNISRAVFIKRYPVLLQGPTSSGKTSMIQYLAAITGHKFVRINNHEHTDLQEYIGSYITDATGKLVFQEGVLVRALRNGHWIVLDELNLAPTDVLEALNRLLDDNRELFVPELFETVRPHPDFMLFATQNPPTFYGGRKMLSRAFRNRFVEIHVDGIPEDELPTILYERCHIPKSYAKRMVAVMKDLQLRRQTSKAFAGKHGFITPRDLLRWAERFNKLGIADSGLAVCGYHLLGERLRDDTEKKVVQEVINRRVCPLPSDLYKQEHGALCQGPSNSSVGNIIWTESMSRLYYLVERCYQMREPVLLVGETGAGKTTVCQLLSMILQSKLHILNCHQYTETSDFIGGFYPIRERSSLVSKFKTLIQKLLLMKPFTLYQEDLVLSEDINKATSTLDKVDNIVSMYRESLGEFSAVDGKDLIDCAGIRDELSNLHQKWQTIFVWQDGPLVEAMKDGSFFLVDEISLADDSVLERLNSVLEPERKLSLPEKGGIDMEVIKAHPKFFLLATMNPGGDFGKKELSPALRNRFTEIWVPPVIDMGELGAIASDKFSCPELSRKLVGPLLKFWKWFNELQTGRTLTVRDLLSWVAFVNTSERCLMPEYAFLHGAFLVLLDGLSLGTGISEGESADLRKNCFNFLVEELQQESLLDPKLLSMSNYGWGDTTFHTDVAGSSNMQCDSLYGMNPFYIQRGNYVCNAEHFENRAPTTCKNVLRILRAMQLSKPVLLEGSPGVGKTSLIIALGNFSGHKVVRINLSEQTDLMDLLGSDLPIESDEGIQFAWSDGILLQALKEGSWVLLDELNLAPQSVLEGLNAILDHRAEVFIPELGRTFKCPPSFRVFACQNPTYQGGGRKGLPKSFLNRFTKVYVDQLNDDDYLAICTSLFPQISDTLLSKLICFNKRLYEETMLFHKFAQDGSPWEFNLRDVIRSCQIIRDAPNEVKNYCFLNVVYIQRMRTAADRREVLGLYEQVFEVKPFLNPYPRVQLDDRFLVVGRTQIYRNIFHSTKTNCHELKILPEIRNMLEATAQCVQQGWLCILVGPTSSGKTSLVRLLAQLTGNVLNEINISSATDISEMLGCFEQYNIYRNYQTAVAQVECYVTEYCHKLLSSSLDAHSVELKEDVSRQISFLSSVNLGKLARSVSTEMEWETSLSLIIKVIEILKCGLEMNIVASMSWSLDDLSRILLIIQKLQVIEYGRPLPVKFEWVAGSLIRAIKNGEWIILEDANLCNPTVLDRINSLAESNGFITVNECGNIDGKPLTLRPHPNFRMFLTVNPTHGEVSRAMRNRGVEIFLMQPKWIQEAERRQEFLGLCETEELSDVKRFLVLSGIPNNILVDSMAKAHIHARDKGLHFSVKISYLELARWVQLFKQFLMTGNELMQSLHSSWEHIYLTSLGEYEGFDVVNQAKASYLSVAGLLSAGSSPVMPGGWPLSLSLRDFILYSKEASVRQNCMYLEFLGSHYASYQYSISENRIQKAHVSSKNSKSVYLVDTKVLQPMMRHKGLEDADCNHSGREFNVGLATKMLLFAANWIVEQATEIDLELYTRWFSWYAGHVHPYCSFFKIFLSLFNQELEYPIWKRILEIRQKVAAQVTASDPDLNVHLNLLPLLAMESADHLVPKYMDVSDARIMSTANKCVGLLRCTLWQWDMEQKHEYDDKAQEYRPVLNSLRCLEEKILETPCFDLHQKLYSDLLEEHISFWNCVATSQNDFLPLIWRHLIKNSLKLEQFCPQAVKILLEEGNRFPWALSSVKPMLWIHGGHPFVPGSAKIYHKLHQLFAFSQLVWPAKRMSEKCVDSHLCDIAASSSSELRLFTVEGLCMSSLLAHETGEDKVEQLEEIHQMLFKRFLDGRDKLKDLADSDANLSALANSASCCIMHPEMICSQSGHNCWLESLPLVDQSSLFLDLPLLQQMPGIILADANQVISALSHLEENLKTALDFSLKFSSRSPLDMLPYQMILYMIDPSASTSAVNCEHASLALEMWFRWHSFLWRNVSTSAEKFLAVGATHIKLSITEAVCNEICPYLLVTPLMTEAVHNKLENMCPVRDYFAQSLKLRAISNSIWKSAAPKMNLASSFLHAARSLLQQIIFAHRKSFSNEICDTIKSRYPSSSTQDHMAKEKEIEALILLLESSTHLKFKSMIAQIIQPLLKELYLKCSSDGPIYHIGCSWLRLGELRFHLLLGFDYLDPTAKYTSKHTRLVEKISSLELEMKVREESNYLAGSLSVGDVNGKLSLKLDCLKDELKRLGEKIVFRPEPAKFWKMKMECDEFLKMVSSVIMHMVKESINNEVDQLYDIVDRAKSWQAAANAFINRLSDDFAGYDDLIQPFQVAVYEMKFGLSLVVSSILENGFAHRLHEDSLGPVLNALYSFMRFPRKCGFKTSMELKMMPSDFTSCTSAYSARGWAENMRIAMKFLKDPIDVGPGKMVSPTLCEDIVGRVVNLVANKRVMDLETFMVLDEIYADFASIWMKMKVEEESTKNSKNEGYLFKPRAFKIEDVYVFDLTALEGSFSSSTFAEWNESHRGDDMEMKGPVDEPEALKMWNAIEDSALRKMVVTHNELFGSIDPVKNLGAIGVSDAQKLASFIDSYTVGVDVLKELKGISAAHLDAKLGPEHLLRLCLGNEWHLTFPCSSVYMFNFYKDSNSPVLGSMVNFLTALQRQLLDLLNKWEEHPGLVKILDIVEMLLCIPINTPLAKALSGLQFLYSKVKMLEEEGSKFPLNDHLQPILDLACSLQKMEFDSWRSVLSEVDSQFEMNAAKLWFPLYSVLHPISSAEISEDDHVKRQVIFNLVEFIETSNVGEFRRRLQLVYAFYGHVTAGLRLNSYQRIIEHITTSRKNVERKLEQLLKLSKWNDRLLPLEDSRRNRQKLKKIIHEYTEILQQPVILILQQKSTESGTKTQYPLHMPHKMQDALTSACGLPHFDDAERLTSHFRTACDLPDPWYRAFWLADWQNDVDQTFQILHSQRGAESNNPDICFKEDVIKQLPIFEFPCLPYLEGWNQVWRTLQGFYLTAVDTSEKWNMEGKNPEKMRALVGLMNLLESSGLAKHKFAFQEGIDKHSESTWWLLLPSYDVKHLLLKHHGITCEEGDFPISEELQCLTHEVFEEEWKIANQYYFKSLASVRDLISLRVNFDQEQVVKSRSFLSQMIVIEQDQRIAAYSFSSPETGDQSFPIPSQPAALRCLWNQKVLYDRLCELSQEETLLLKIVGSTHMSSCQSVKPAATPILSLLEKFAPRFMKSKALLDDALLGNSRADIKLATSAHLVIVSKEMELLITENFEILKEFKGLVSEFPHGKHGSIVETLLGHFEAVFKEGQEAEEVYSNKEVKYDLKKELQYENELISAVDNVFGYVMDVFQGLGSLNNRLPTDVSWENITLWRTLFDSYVEDLHLNLIYDEFVKAMSTLYDRIIEFLQGKLTIIPKRCADALQQIHQLLDVILAFCDGLLHDFLAVHKMVAVVTHKLAETFTTLFSKGYQKPTEDLEDESGSGMTKDATGTGMGEGSGVKDVSDQITDEDQLLGTSEKKEEEEDGSNQMPSKNDKGIEMGEDFEGDVFDVSEDSAADDDDDDDDDDPDQLDNEMGKAGDDGEVAAEKLWNKEEDEKPENADEKHESGPSVSDKDPSNRELRGKEDSAAATDELDGTSGDKEGDKDEMDLGLEDNDDLENNGDERNVKKNDALPDLEGLDLSEPFKEIEEDAEMEVDEEEDPVEEGEKVENDELVNHGDAEEMDDAPNEEGESNQLGETEKDDSKNHDEGDETTGLTDHKNDMPLPGNPEINDELVQDKDTPYQPIDNFQGASSSTAAEVKWSAGTGNQNDFAPSDAREELGIQLGNSKGEKLAKDQPKSEGPQDSESLQKNQPNPLRNIGDALEGWKDRVKVSTDVQDDNRDTCDDLMDDDADEYGFTSELDKGTAQAQGPAMADQIKESMIGDNPDEDRTANHRDNPTDMETEYPNQDVEAQAMNTRVTLQHRVEEQIRASSPENLPEEEIPVGTNGNVDDLTNSEMESIISVERTFTRDLNEVTVKPHQQRTVDNAEAPSDVSNATALWRKYEFQTTRLSQELAEQLRLVMEPTLASKLQGDYKTGKRINMKKVIPYVASHYRKDKIWLRRTRPNKRDYQVVIAVDDSRSMLESGCGDFAIEALVTVCRAMSQLEVGKLAVTSYGQAGNVKLLHDFEQPFTGEAGVKMISSLTFKQENTIEEEPMVDLLTYLNHMLDDAVVNARLPSGQNPLQQLVLIIADGRLSEKTEKLKRYVRELTNQKRMVAFLLLDSSRESIMDYIEASVEGGKVTIAKYLDKFPFPYYIILKNIEALPRTLADLLRQWFEVFDRGELPNTVPVSDVNDTFYVD